MPEEAEEPRAGPIEEGTLAGRMRFSKRERRNSAELSQATGETVPRPPTHIRARNRSLRRTATNGSTVRLGERPNSLGKAPTEGPRSGQNGRPTIGAAGAGVVSPTALARRLHHTVPPSGKAVFV